MSLIYKGKIIADAGGSTGDTYLVKAPVGTIVIWSGTAENIPTGWSLCDGQDGRPDLRDKFVLGAGETHAVGETGGEEEHTLTIEEMPSHSHNIDRKGGSGTSYNNSGRVYPTITNSSNQFNERVSNEPRFLTLDAGQSSPHNNMPPYYALCYIIKVTADETDGGGGSSQEIYSTEETRIGTWIDGKPLYRQSFDFTILADKDNEQYVYVETSLNDIIPTNLYGVVNFYWPNESKKFYYFVPCGEIKQEYSRNWCINPYYEEGIGLIITYNMRPSGASFSVSLHFVLTVEYTKPTDTGVTA